MDGPHPTRRIHSALLFLPSRTRSSHLPTGAARYRRDTNRMHREETHGSDLGVHVPLWPLDSAKRSDRIQDPLVSGAQPHTGTRLKRAVEINITLLRTIMSRCATRCHTGPYIQCVLGRAGAFGLAYTCQLKKKSVPNNQQIHVFTHVSSTKHCISTK